MHVVGLIYLVALVAYIVGYFAAGQADRFPFASVLAIVTIVSGTVLAIHSI